MALACLARSEGDAGSRARREYAAFAAAAEAPLEAAMRRFDGAAAGSDIEARLTEARRALEEARSLRDVLEARPAPAGLAYASGEELVFANHFVDGLAVFAESDGGRAALETLQSVLARGRTHRERGRAARR